MLEAGEDKCLNADQRQESRHGKLVASTSDANVFSAARWQTPPNRPMRDQRQGNDPGDDARSAGSPEALRVGKAGAVVLVTAVDRQIDQGDKHLDRPGNHRDLHQLAPVLWRRREAQKDEDVGHEVESQREGRQDATACWISDVAGNACRIGKEEPLSAASRNPITSQWTDWLREARDV
jgi:hypothetical protein